MTDQSKASLVVVGVDGSPASIDAVRWAARYAGMTGADLVAVTSWEPHAGFSAGVGPGASINTLDIDWEGKAITTLYKTVVAALPDGHESVQRGVVCGRPADALLTAAEGADLLVVGSRGHGGFVGMLLGSVSTHVVAHAPCPVVVVRHPTDPVDTFPPQMAKTSQ